MGDRGGAGRAPGGHGEGVSAMAVPFMGGLFVGAGMTSAAYLFMQPKEKPENTNEPKIEIPEIPAGRRKRCTCKAGFEVWDEKPKCEKE